MRRVHRRVFRRGLFVRLFAGLPVLVTRVLRFFPAMAERVGKPSVSAGDEGELRAGFAELILGQGPKPPMFGRLFSQASSLRNMELCNSEQSIHRPVLKLAQLLPNSIRRCLSRTYFDGDELDYEDLCEALSKHAEC